MAGISRQKPDANQLTADFQGDLGWDTNDATFIMKKHRESLTREIDFWFLSRNGINIVRIPVGCWIASDSNPPAPYVSWSLQALDNAFQWAKHAKNQALFAIELLNKPGAAVVPLNVLESYYKLGYSTVQ